MPVVRLLRPFLFIALLSVSSLLGATLQAKPDPVGSQQQTLVPFSKKAPSSLIAADPIAPLPPAPAPRIVRRAVYPPGSISAANYWGFELGMTAGMLAGGDISFLFPYPYDNGGKGDVQEVGKFKDHSIGLRYSIAGVLDYSINQRFALQGKLGYRVLGASGEKATDFDCFIGGVTPNSRTATFHESYEMDLRYLSLDLLSRMSIIQDGLYGLAGFGISTLLSSEVDAIESISSPNNCQYTYTLNGLPTGQFTSQSLDMDAKEDIVGGRFDIRAGLGTFISIGKGMFLTPELTVGIPLNSVIDPATNDKFGIRSSDLPAHFFAALSIGLKFPWGNYTPQPYYVEDTLVGEDEDVSEERKIIGYIAVREGDALEGKITDADGNLIRDGSVVIVDLGTNKVVAKNEAPDGTYHIEIEAPGRYSVTADAPGYLFGSTMFEIDADGHIMKQAGDIKLARSSDGRVRLLVFFESNKAILQTSSYPELDRAAALMNANPTMEVEIAGYSDSKGTDAYNKDLSQRRAAAVKDYIIKQGVSASRLIAIGYGEASPIATNDTEEGRAENRRVEFVVRRK